MGNPVISKNGTNRWFDANGDRHRDNGPAVEYTDGTNGWYQHGKLHRDDGPAYEYTSGRKEWFQHGKYHREDGPAVEWADGEHWWWLNHIHMSFDEWLDRDDMSDEDRVMMKLKYG
jgi:hypothetical protein